MMQRPDRGGLALIIVAGVLGLLAALAMAFTTLAQIERRASRQRLNATKAYLLARSGLEDAMARLGSGQDPLLASNCYGGENWDGSPDGTLSALEAAQEVYHPTGVGSRADVDSCPAAHAMRPSFFAKLSSGSPDPALVGDDGRRRGYSGRISGDVYTLKVTTEGGFYVNGGDPSISVNTAVSDYNLNLRRMLGILAEAIDREDGTPGDGPVGQADGFNLIDSRPRTSRGWESWKQVRDGALGGSQAKLDALRPYLALHARVDRKVIRPNAVPGASLGTEGMSYQSWADIKMAHETYPLALGTKEPDFERIPVLPGGRIVGRAPVDLAWARTRRPVLIALLAGLKGLYLDEGSASPISASPIAADTIGRLRSGEIALDWTATSDVCRQTADLILASTSEFRTWEQWNAFCDDHWLPTDTAPAAALAAFNAAVITCEAARVAWMNVGFAPGPEQTAFNAAYNAENAARAALGAARSAHNGGSWLDETDMGGTYVWIADANAVDLTPINDLLKANFNPNSDLNKFGPNASLWRSVDKSDLLVYSTEFSLLPQASPQELECVGRVLGRNGRVLASRVLKATIAPAGLLTLSTQKEFVCGDLGDPSVAGDEVSPRLPGAQTFISQSWGTGKTWGHRLDMTTPYPSSWMNGTSAGASLQTYPEPCVDTGSGLSVRPADYDGSVQLATVETQDNDYYTADSGIPTANMKLLARYTAGLDLDVSDAAPSRPTGDPRWMNQPDPLQVTYNGAGSPNLIELGNGLLDAARPNTLYPDGVYSEKDRAPSYLDKDNANGFHGVISFWIKSNYVPTSGNRGRYFVERTNFSDILIGDGPNQCFLLVQTSFSEGIGLACQFETGHSGGDPQMERRFERSSFLTSRRWSLVTMYYDFLSPSSSSPDDCGELLVDAGNQAIDVGSINAYPSSAANDPSLASDISLDHILPDGSTGAHTMDLGATASRGADAFVRDRVGSSADSSFDELAIYDFGGATLVSGISTAAPDATLQSPGILAAARFKEGRYYRESAYTNLASAGTNRAAEYFSPPISLGPCRIKALAWTQVVPRGLKSPIADVWDSASGTFVPGKAGVDGDPAGGPADPIDGDPGDGRIVLELADSSGTGYLQDASGTSINTLFTRSALERVDRAVNAPFRLHAVFQPNLRDRENTPILDPLALDDVTVVYEPLGGRRILAWGAGD